MNKSPFILVIVFILINMNAQSEELLIGTELWTPYNDIHNTEYPGLSTEVISAVLEKMKIAFSIKEYPWRRALHNVSDGKIDAVYSALYTQERAGYCYYPEESLIDIEVDLYVKAEKISQLKYNSKNDLINKKVGIVRGSAYPQVFMDFIKTYGELDYSDDEKVTIKKLLNGSIDYIMMSSSHCSLLLEEMDLVNKIVPATSKTLSIDSLFMIFSKKTIKPDLVKRFSDELEKFKQTEHYKKLYSKYITNN